MRSLSDRFWSKVDTSAGPFACWPWLAHVCHWGYGQFGMAGKVRYAHVVSHELNIGPVPTDYEVDHLCRNRRCVNPAHLEAVSKETNVLRGTSPPAENARKTHCANGHEYTKNNTRMTRNGWRGCRKCQNNRSRAAYHRRKHATA